jgi:agmatinase
MKTEFNPSGFAQKNGNFIGLPYNEDEAKIILLPVPWEATVSYAAGTATGPENIRDASYQLDLFDADVENAYKIGIFMKDSDADILDLSTLSRELATMHIDNLENGHEIVQEFVDKVNANSAKVNHWVKEQCANLLKKGKAIGLIGGEHSTPLGYLHALSEKYSDFGILQIDAHCDLRKAYEGFTYSHASIFYNVLEEIPAVSKLVQVGIRDYCEEEVNYIETSHNRIEVFYDQAINESLFDGKSFRDICLSIIEKLPQHVYISFDIDGLWPNLCPNTGTPVAGGLSLPQAFYLLKTLAESGRTIIGFDLCEVGSAEEWDGNVGARVLYKMANLMGKTLGLS